MEFLSKDGLLAITPTIEEIEVAELGSMIRVKRATAREKNEWEAQTIGISDPDRMRELITTAEERYVARYLVDEKGKRIYTTGEDIANLGGITPQALDALYQAVLKVNPLGPVQKEEVEKEIKNSETIPSSDLLSDSLDT
ncbi:MAG: hypothetical protein K2X93_06725 [Candidatus Obscuribacterales bacterium]|nr:hypothetical protein [Candidatus Obscuribacterales bacterium]